MELKEGYIRKQLMKVRVELLLEFYANISANFKICSIASSQYLCSSVGVQRFS